jgi:hypothetical protein
VETSLSACLPVPWSQADTGAVKIAGSAEFDGAVFTLEAAGTDIGGKSDESHFAFVPLSGDGALTARVLPQVSSQSSRMGIVLRESAAPSGPRVALLLTPVYPPGDHERPAWHAVLSVRTATGEEAAQGAASSPIESPAVTWGRLTGPFWLRLERAGNRFTASLSYDGTAWRVLGQLDAPLNQRLLAGIAACSGIPSITTTVRFDRIELAVSRVHAGPMPDGEPTSRCATILAKDHDVRFGAKSGGSRSVGHGGTRQAPVQSLRQRAPAAFRADA